MFVTSEEVINNKIKLKYFYFSSLESKQMNYNPNYYNSISKSQLSFDLLFNKE